MPAMEQVMHSGMGQVAVSSVQDLPVQTRSTSGKLVRIISATAKSKPKLVPPILLGRVNGLCYAVNDFETVLGLRNAGVDRMNAFVTDYDSMHDLLVAHVRKNFHPQTIDPLKIRQVIDYMVDGGIEISDAIKMLWIDKRAELRDTIRAELTEDARNVFLNMLEEISKKMYFVAIPAYYVTRVAKIAKREQLYAATEIMTYTIPRMTSDAKSLWPSSDTIEHVLSKFHNHKKIPPVSERISSLDEDQSGETEDKEKPEKKKPSDKTVKKAEKFIASDPNLIYVPIEGEHPDLLLNKRTGRVAVATEKEGVYSVSGDIGKSKRVLAENVVKYLGIDDNDSMSFGKFPSSEKAQAALAKSKNSGQKYVIIPDPRQPRS